MTIKFKAVSPSITEVVGTTITISKDHGEFTVCAGDRWLFTTRYKWNAMQAIKAIANAVKEG